MKKPGSPLAFVLLLIFGGCTGPTGAQGDPPPSSTWGSAELVSYEGAAVNVSGTDVAMALDELAPNADAAALLQADRGYCGFVIGNQAGGNFGGYSGTLCEGAGGDCTGLEDLHACFMEEMIESHLGGITLDDTVWVYDPRTCDGLTSLSSTRSGLRWGPGFGFSVLSCDDALDKLACCGRAR